MKKIIAIVFSIFLLTGCGEKEILSEVKEYENIKYQETNKKTNNVLIELESEEKIIMELYPENLNYKDGVQKYLQYCVDNGITKEYIDDKTGFDTPDIMDFFDDLTFHGSMQYKGYYVEVGDVNYDNPNENIVTIYGSKEDSLNGDFLENISLNTLLVISPLDNFDTNSLNLSFVSFVEVKPFSVLFK